MEVILSVQIRHPKIESKILKQKFEFGRMLGTEFSVNGKMDMRRGKVSNTRNISYLAYLLFELQPISDLEKIINDANSRLEKSIKNKKWFHHFIDTGGTVSYYITLVVNEYDSFELSPETLKNV